MSKVKSIFNTFAQKCGLVDSNPQQFDMVLFNKYKNIALNMYRWDNLPLGVESRHIEQALFNNGQAFFTIDKNIGHIVLPCSQEHHQNIYGDPTRVRLTGVGYSTALDIGDGVRILNNDSIMPTIVNILYYLDKILSVEKTIDKNLEQQRNPYFFRTTKDNEFSMKAIAKKIENDETAIFVDKELDMGNTDGIVKEDIWKDFRALEYNKLKLEYEKEMLTCLGLNTVIQKESGLSTDEVNVNNSEIDMILDLGFKCREEACKKINVLYGLDIKVTKVIKSISSVKDYESEDFDNE